MSNFVDFADHASVKKAQNEMMNEGEFSMTADCPHCANVHVDLRFGKLAKPVDTPKGPITHVGLCPETGLQIKVGFPDAGQVVQQYSAAFTKELGERLKTENMTEDQIQKVLTVMADLGKQGAL